MNRALNDPSNRQLTAAVDRAAEAVGRAGAMIIAAGAGMGVDSGLPDFRGPMGFWRAYPAIARLGLCFEEMAVPHWFNVDPHLAWGFYGHRLDLYRRTNPHRGYEILRDLSRTKRAFVLTTNVDGHFQRAGFAEENIWEIHGSIYHLQCSLPCHDRLWPAPIEPLDIDETTLRAASNLPSCPDCGRIARPNILMFGDLSWISHRAETQRTAFYSWIKELDSKVVVLELGAGAALPTLRCWSERLLVAGAALCRINPRESAGPAGCISIPMGALAALEAIHCRAVIGGSRRSKRR